jgi:hypothetical protein
MIGKGKGLRIGYKVTRENTGVTIQNDSHI